MNVKELIEGSQSLDDRIAVYAVFCAANLASAQVISALTIRFGTHGATLLEEALAQFRTEYGE